MAKHMGENQRQDTGIPRPFAAAFVAVVLLALAMPLAGMALAPTTSTSENRELAAWPKPLVEGAPNVDYLSQAGAFFEDHFAFKNELIDLDARIKAGVFSMSSTQRVIVGTDGWLFYRGTLDDYQRTNTMSSRAIANAVHNIALMQEFVEGQGANFVITLAPDKNALYPEHMPYFLPRGSGQNNFQRMLPLMEAAGIRYLNLHEVLGGVEGVVYRKTDSHWDNEGARIAYDALLSSLGHPHDSLEGTPTTTTSSVGDVASMLFPLSAPADEQILYEQSQLFEYTGEASDVEASTIQTAGHGAGATGTLICYRDSFGNALLPYLASAYEQAHFSKMMPYDLGLVAYMHADDVIVERTERHASTFATNPPYMPAPERRLDAGEIVDAGEAATFSQVENGPYLQVGGSINEDHLPVGSRVLVCVSHGGVQRAFECFLVSSELEQVLDVEPIGGVGADEVEGDLGYRAYLPLDLFAENQNGYTLEVMVLNDGQLTRVASSDFEST